MNSFYKVKFYFVVYFDIGLKKCLKTDYILVTSEVPNKIWWKTSQKKLFKRKTVIKISSLKWNTWTYEFIILSNFLLCKLQYQYPTRSSTSWGGYHELSLQLNKIFLKLAYIVSMITQRCTKVNLAATTYYPRSLYVWRTLGNPLTAMTNTQIMAHLPCTLRVIWPACLKIWRRLLGAVIVAKFWKPITYNSVIPSLR